MDRKIEGIIAALMTVIWLVLLNVFFSGKVTAPDQVKILPDMRITYIRLEATPEYTAVSYDDVPMKNNSNVISGAIGAKGYHLDSPVDLAVFNTERLIFKHSIRINQNFKFNLPEKLNKDARIKFELLDRHGNILNKSSDFQLAAWHVLTSVSQPLKKNFGDISFGNSRLDIKNFKIVNTPKTGLSFTNKIAYQTTLPMQMNRSDNDETNVITARPNSIRPITKFETNLLLPTETTNLVNWANPQGSMIHGDKLYIVYESNTKKKYGRVVMFDLKKLGRAGVIGGGKNRLRELEKLVNSQTFISTKMVQALDPVQVGPEFYTGHGQALSFDAKSKRLWLMAEGDDAYKQSLTQVDLKTLAPVAIADFSFTDPRSHDKINSERNFAIDNTGNMYIVSVVTNKTKKDTNLQNGDVMLYHGRMVDGKPKFSITPTVIRSKPGYYTQFLSFNEKDQKLYYITDGAYLAIPMTKWLVGSLTYPDFDMGVYATQDGGTREFEAMYWGPTHQSYLVVNRGAELMKAQ